MKNNTFLLHRILEICQIIDGQRSKMGIVSILYGKRNHQTWSDTHLFQLHKYYRFLFKEDEQLLDYCFQELLQLGYITILGNEVFVVTKKGEQFLFSQQTASDYNFRDGRIIQKMDKYWSFLHLLIQTLSNLLHHQLGFLPVVRDAGIQTDVKHWIAEHGVVEGAKGLYKELLGILQDMPEHYCNMLMLRLSGQHRIGLTLLQLSKQYNRSYWETKWEWESLLYQLFNSIHKNNYQFLPTIHKSNILLSGSSRETWLLLQRNMTITEISKTRKLKEATIMDHIIELALTGIDFNYFLYISDEEINKVEELYILLGSKRLKTYKERLPNLSYFQIRLALTILDRGNANEINTFSE